MQIQVLKSKIHRVKITRQTSLLVGSITNRENLMDAAKVWSRNEKVQVVNVNNGERLGGTYVIKGEEDRSSPSRQVCLNGPAAKKKPLLEIL